MTEKKSITEALSWFTAERFKSLQRKLTTARNTIQNDALSSQLRPLYSEDEIRTLNEAARVLGSVKSKVEHAKEKKAREEAARDRHLEQCKRQRRGLLVNALPRPKQEEDARQVLLWLLALSLHHEEISRYGYYYESKYFGTDIERAFGTATHHTVLGTAVSWWEEVTNFLDEHLWPYDKEPDPARLDQLKKQVIGAWTEEVSAFPSTKALLERFDTEMAIRGSERVHRL